MDKLRIFGGNALHGSIQISGAKNAALPLLASCLLTEETLTLNNVPNLTDINTLIKLLEQLGVSGGFDSNNQKTLHIQAKKISNPVAPYELVKQMRASILVLGPLTARTGEAKVSLPGGCAIGVRPVDLHIKGLEALGAEVSIENGYIHSMAPNGLKGTTFSFPVATVTGTENIMMAATLAKGTTTLVNAALEPEIVDLANCLIKMGAKISGHGTPVITIEGVDKLHGATHDVISDRIEAGTYAVAAAITNGDVTLVGNNLDVLLATSLSFLEQTGCEIFLSDKSVRIKSVNRPKSLDITTEPYPGFPTDLQAQTMALMSIGDGVSVVNETIWENRFMHIPELNRMGADITVHGSTAVVRGVPKLFGAPVQATDLRASFCLVLAGLSAEGETVLDRLYHLDRGYESVEEKLTSCGARVERFS